MERKSPSVTDKYHFDAKSALFAEVRQAKRCRRLIFLLVLDADNDQNHNGNQERKHLEDLLAGKLNTRNVFGGNVKGTKYD